MRTLRLTEEEMNLVASWYDALTDVYHDPGLTEKDKTLSDRILRALVTPESTVRTGSVNEELQLQSDLQHKGKQMEDGT